jgi:hypothetical protein
MRQDRVHDGGLRGRLSRWIARADRWAAGPEVALIDVTAWTDRARPHWSPTGLAGRPDRPGAPGVRVYAEHWTPAAEDNAATGQRLTAAAECLRDDDYLTGLCVALAQPDRARPASRATTVANPDLVFQGRDGAALRLATRRPRRHPDGPEEGED